MEEVELLVEVVRKGSQRVKVRKGARVEDIVKLLGLNTEEYVAVLDGRVVPDDELVVEPSKLKLIPVVSGG